MARPTRRSPSARCSPPRRRAAPSEAPRRSLLVMVPKPSWSLYRGRARGRERVRPNERAILKHTTTRDRRPPLGARTFASHLGVDTEPACQRRTSRSSAAITRPATARAARAARSAWTTGAGSTRGPWIALVRRCRSVGDGIARALRRRTPESQRVDGARRPAISTRAGARRSRSPARPGPSARPSARDRA